MTSAKLQARTGLQIFADAVEIYPPPSIGHLRYIASGSRYAISIGRHRMNNSHMSVELLLARIPKEQHV